MICNKVKCNLDDQNWSNNPFKFPFTVHDRTFAGPCGVTNGSVGFNIPLLTTSLL